MFFCVEGIFEKIIGQASTVRKPPQPNQIRIHRYVVVNISCLPLLVMVNKSLDQYFHKLNRYASIALCSKDSQQHQLCPEGGQLVLSKR